MQNVGNTPKNIIQSFTARTAEYRQARPRDVDTAATLLLQDIKNVGGATNAKEMAQMARDVAQASTAEDAAWGFSSMETVALQAAQLADRAAEIKAKNNKIGEAIDTHQLPEGFVPSVADLQAVGGAMATQAEAIAVAGCDEAHNEYFSGQVGGRAHDQRVSQDDKDAANLDGVAGEGKYRQFIMPAEALRQAKGVFVQLLENNNLGGVTEGLIAVANAGRSPIQAPDASPEQYHAQAKALDLAMPAKTGATELTQRNVDTLMFIAQELVAFERGPDNGGKSFEQLSEVTQNVLGHVHDQYAKRQDGIELDRAEQGYFSDTKTLLAINPGALEYDIPPVKAAIVAALEQFGVEY